MSAFPVNTRATITGGAPWVRRRAATMRLLIVAIAGVCLVLTGCTVTATGRPAAAPDLGRWQPAPILPQQLEDLLLSAADVNSVGHTTAMTLRMPLSTMAHAESLVGDPNCLDAYSPIQATVYQDSSWTALQGQLLDNAESRNDPIRHSLLQAVVGFGDADSAKRFFGQARPRWSACANRPLTVTRPGRAPVVWVFGDLAATDTTLSIMQTEEAGGGFACHRAIGLANNVIIDTLWCGSDTTDQAGRVVTKIAASVSQA